MIRENETALPHKKSAPAGALFFVITDYFF